MSSDNGKRVRIAYLIDTIANDTEGTQKQLLETIRRLDRARFEPLLVCLRESAWMAGNSLPCPVHVLGYRGFLKTGFPGVVRRLAGLIDHERIDVMQTFFQDSIFVAYLGSIIAGRSPVLLSSRRDMGLGQGNQPFYHGLFRQLLPFVNRAFSGIVANCEQVRSYVAQQEKTSPDRVRVIRNGVQIPERPRAAPERLCMDDGIVRIGLVASLTPVKRHDLLIDALAGLHGAGVADRLRVYLLGDGPERARLESRVSAAGLDEIVTFAGAVRDVPAYLYNLDIGVLCSDREGLSNAILEYMACGLPVIASSTGGNCELVDETNGICFPVGDCHALAAALEMLATNPGERSRLGAASLEKIRQSYSWQRAMASLEDYYLELVGQVPC